MQIAGHQLVTEPLAQRMTDGEGLFAELHDMLRLAVLKNFRDSGRLGAMGE
jgi:hypothetical protein